MAGEHIAARLGDHVEILAGFAFPSSRFDAEEGLPLVRIRDLSSETTETRFRGAFDPRFVLSNGDVLIGMDGDFVVVRWSGGPALLNQRVCRVRAKGGIADEGFIFRSLQPLVEIIHRKTSATTVRHLSTKDLERATVALPPLPEQRQIAAILDTLDDAIRKTEQIIAKLKQVKQGLLHDLLTRGIDDNGELRDPDRHPEQFKESPLGRIPKGWELSSLRELAQGGLANGVFKEPSRAGRGCPLVNVGDLYAPFGIDLDRVERFAATPAELSRFSVKAGDIYFTRSSLALAGIAQCNIVRDAPIAAVYECHVVRLRPVAQWVVPEYLAHWCRSPVARSFLMGRAKQVTMTTIAQPDIHPLPVPLPSLTEQRAVVSAVDAAEDRIQKELGAAEKLKLAKLGLMEDLLTGRVRASRSTA